MCKDIHKHMYKPNSHDIDIYTFLLIFQSVIVIMTLDIRTMDDLVMLVVSIIVATIILGSTIYTIFQIRKFKALMDQGSEFFQIRHPTLTTSYIIGFLCVFYLFNPSILLLSNIFNISSVHLYLIQITDSIISLLIFPRAIVYCFDRAFVDHLRNWIWRREIHHNDTNLFIKYRGIWQHAHIIIITLYTIILFPLFLLLHLYASQNHHLYLALIICLSLLYTLTLYLTHTINGVTDEYSIKPEAIASVTSTGGLYIVTHIIHYICFHLVGTSSAIHWGVILQILFNSAITIFALYYGCIWTTNQYLFQTLLCGSSAPQPFKRISFRQIMDHRAGIESFCNHLSREFGLESILFLLEVTQFKAIIHARKPEIPDNICTLMRVKHSDTFSVNITNIRWLPIDPRMHTQTPYQVALHLYDKYVDESADLCINISYINRNQIYRDFQSLAKNNMDHRDGTTQTAHLEAMFALFDGAFSEIWRLIAMDSYRRYRATEECDRVIASVFSEDDTPVHGQTKSANDLVVHVQQNAKYMKQQTNSPGESQEDTDAKEEQDTVGESKAAHSIEMHLADGSEESIEVQAQNIDHIPIFDSPLALSGSLSQPPAHSRTRLQASKVPTLGMQSGSAPASFAEQNSKQRTASLKAPFLRSRAGSFQLPRPTTYRYMIKTQSLREVPQKQGQYYINSNNQTVETNHLTTNSFSLRDSDQAGFAE
eukprot:533385_1